MEQPEIYAQAQKLFAKKDFDGALDALDAILEKNAADAVALALAGDIYAASGDVQQAMGHYGLAVQAAPGNVDYKRQFIHIAGKMAFAQHNPAIEEILCLCLKTPEIECAHAHVLWYSLIRSHPQFLALLKNPFEKPVDISFLLQPIFLLGIKRIVICNMEFEGFMTALRRFLLEQGGPGALIEAVARYCFNTDYIFNRTEAEEKKIADLHLELENNPAARQDVVKTGIYACYEPFYKLKIAKDLVLLPDLKAQLEDYLDLQNRAAKIPSLTEITDAVSLKVREQYEEFPYPRWRELPISAKSPAFNKAGIQILVAGCGTGQEPLILAQSYPQAEILAIDLSRTSLAYAARKAEELGIKNVAFRHADILQLGSLDKKFDCICAGGVLHHMQDPVAGWKVLTKLLKPGGFMRIGLYSALARRSVVKAWEMIRKGNYPDTAAGMRRFRKDSEKLLSFDKADYYYLNMYRDLLFHVQEHQFTLPQIQKILDDLGLAFIEFFDLPPSWETKAKTLADWNKIEEANPDLFSRMYQFWCRKKS
jgi:ubiquinone/menaquinone biosynthesis C-methylase UbiE